MKLRSALLFMAVAGALATNILLFMLIPLLSHISAEKQPEAVNQAFTFNNLRQSQPPPPDTPPKEPPKPRELPKTPPVATAMGRSQSSPAPKSPAMSASPPQFEAAVSDLEFGTTSMAFSTPVAAPQSEFDISQVDAMPQVISRRDPVYPYSARQKNLSGIVMLKFLVTPEGNVQQVSVVQSNPPGVFDDAAIQAVSAWRFKPGTLDGEAVSTWMAIPLRFKLQ